MKLKAITVTEAARNFAHTVNQVHYQRAGFVLMKNGRPFAQLVPAGERVCTGRELAGALQRVPLSPAESRAWAKDMAVARRRLKTPADKWQ